MNLSYLIDLGYTAEEIKDYSDSCNENIIRFLSDNSISVFENMEYLKDDFDKRILFKLSVFYPLAFALPNNVFAERLSVLQKAFPDSWTEIIEQQFFGYEGIDTVYVTEQPSKPYAPFMEEMSASKEKAEKSVESLLSPWDRDYKFLHILNSLGIEFDISDFELDMLLELETTKWDIKNSAESLMEQGLGKEAVAQLLYYKPYLMMESTIMVNNILCDDLGKNYIEQLNDAFDNDEMEDLLFNLSF